jgi:hypothetical protein
MVQLRACHFPSWPRVIAIIACLCLSGSSLIPAARAQEAFTVNVSLASATLDKSGVITLTGTLTCSEPADNAWVEAYVSQPVGRLKMVYGYGSDYELGACDVTPLPLEVMVMPDTGKFAPGTVYVTVYAGACTDPSDWNTCSFDELRKPLKLKNAQ